MRASRQVNVTLPAEMADIVDGKVRSGAYASASDMLLDGVRALIDRDAALEHWLRDEVTRGHVEYLADPSRGVDIDSVLPGIRTRRDRLAVGRKDELYA